MVSQRHTVPGSSSAGSEHAGLVVVQKDVADPDVRDGTHMDTLQLSVAGALSQLFVAATYLLAARSASPADYGAVVSVTAAATAVGGLLDWGSGTNALRRLASQNMTTAYFHAWWRGRTALLVGFGAIFGFFVAGWHQTLVLVAVGAAGMLALPPVVFAASIPQRVQGRFRFVAITTSLTRGCGLAIMGSAAVLSERPYVFLPLALSTSLLLEGVVYRWGSPPDRTRGPRLVWKVWRGTGWIGLSSAILSMQSLDVTVASRSGGASVAGEYAAVNRWTSPLGLPASAFTQAVAPRLAGATSHREALYALKPGLKWLWLVAGVALLVVVFSRPLTSLLLGSLYAASADTLRILAVGTVVAVVNQPLFAFLLARHRDVSAAAAAGALIASQLALIALLAPKMGASGAALAFVAGQAVALLVLAGLSWRCLQGDDDAP